MTKIVEHTNSKLVIENKPRFAFGIAIGLGAIAFLASAYALLFSGDGFSKDTAFGLVLGLVFVIGGLLLYRETVTVLDKRTGKVTWKQEGLLVSKSDSAKLGEIKKVVVGHTQGDEMAGSPTQINLILENRSIPLMFGFSGTNRDEEISAAIQSFLGKS